MEKKMKHLCQGPKCHTYETQSRIRGPKGSKVLRTRFARFNSEVNHDWVDNWEHYFCDERCMNNWLDKHLAHLMNVVGINTKPQESPVDIVETVHQDYAGRDYMHTTIKLLNSNAVEV